MFPIGLIFANIADALNLVDNKFVLSRLKVPNKTFLVLVFFLAFILCALVFPFLAKIDLSNFSYRYLFLFLLMTALAITHNFLFQRALRSENVNEVELYHMLTPLSVILFAAILVPGEFSWKPFVAAMAGAIALIFAHLEKRHLKFDRYTPLLLFYLILIALDVVVIKLLLGVFSPIALYFFRCGAVFLFYLIIFGIPRQEYKLINIKNILFIAFLWVVYSFFTMESYVSVGVVTTTLFLLIAPAMVYLLSHRYFGERIQKRQIISTLIIVAAIIFCSY